MASKNVDLAEDILKAVNARLERKGLLLKKGSIVDATIIAAPSSTKNQQGERDPEMHQTKKGNQWHFGMKAHIAVDAHSGLVHLAGVALLLGQTSSSTGRVSQRV
jgi:IS5 family transposase